jgi:hypothetical protein
MAITSWTDNGMQWPLVKDQPILASHINAVRNAYRERALAQKHNFGSFAFEVLAGQPVTFYRPASFSNLVEQIEEARGKFLNANKDRQWNHNTVGTGGDTLTPWTEASMLADMGIPSFEVPSRNGHVTVKWLNEQYEFINRILWFNPAVFFPPNFDFDDYFRRVSTSPFAAAVTAFNAEPWGFNPFANQQPGHYNENEGGGSYEIKRVRRIYSFTNLYNGNGSEHETVMYAALGRDANPINGFPTPPPLDEYENNDYFSGEGVWTTIETQAATALSSHTITIGDFGDNTSTSGVALGDWRGWRSTEANTKLALKYNIITGFQFQF